MTGIDERLRRIKFIVCDADGVLTDGRIWYDGAGRPFRSIHARDATGLTMWHLVGGMSAIVSGLGSEAIDAIARQWRCVECHMYVRDKVRVCREMAERRGVSLEEMAFVGDDLIDVCAMREVGLGVAVGDAAPEAKEAAHMATQAPGGNGAGREVVHRVLDAQGRLQEAVEAYLGRKDD